MDTGGARGMGVGVVLFDENVCESVPLLKDHICILVHSIKSSARTADSHLTCVAVTPSV